MLVLGIETSGLDGSVALLRDGNCLGERKLNQVGRRHAQMLVFEIGDLLKVHDLKPSDVELVAVSRGPGSFTGLRVGMVCAKTFAYATRCRFIAIDTFLAIAENAPPQVDHLFVIEDAQRDELFAGEYVRDDSGNWKQLTPIQIISVEQFCKSRSKSDIVTGAGIKKIDPADVCASWLIDEGIRLPRANVIAHIGSRRSKSDSDALPSDDTDFWRASPFYLRLSAAEEKRAAMK